MEQEEQPREGWQNSEPTAEEVQRLNETPLMDRADDQLTEFQKGARAMFDALTFRAANHWHPNAMDQCNYDNKLIYEWAEDALEEVDEFSGEEWKSMQMMFKDGIALGKSMTTVEVDNGHSNDHIDSLKMMTGVCGIMFAFTLLAILIHSKITPEMVVWVLAFYAVIFMFAAIFLSGKASTLKFSQRGGAGFKPPRPLPPSTPPAGWTPKSQ